MKKILILSAELFSFVVVGLLLGWFLDKVFSLEGWGSVFCVILVYTLWFIKFLKRFR
ncbi:MAG: hypothetical protein OXC37_06345 [Bdellovibrionaceae bacterium]|nr:hypothetical protein [Pseudobdellovibrionaceae bacterium]